jgi:AcrR family transcriptional regulator
MNEREKNILSAAERVFSRYGVKRASMSDVAEEAGISRQTLYKAFRSKDDILRTHIHAYTDNAIAEIDVGLAKTEGLGARIDLILEKMVVAGFDMVRASPNAQDIIEGVNAATKEELEITAGRFQAVIKEVLQPYEAALTAAGTSPDALAEFVQRSARAAKGYAQDRKHLLQQLHTIRQLCLVAAKQ